MDPYAKPNERKTGRARPKILHTRSVADSRTRQDREKEKEGIKAERRAIKKAARRHLKRQMLSELEENG
jgi:hypothetical protein